MTRKKSKKPTQIINTPQGSLINNVYVPNNGMFQYYDTRTNIIKLAINVCGSLFEVEQGTTTGTYKIARPI